VNADSSLDLSTVEVEILSQIDYTEHSLGHGLDWERILCRAHGGDVFAGLDRLLAAGLISEYLVKDCPFYRTTVKGLAALAKSNLNTNASIQS
jgi:hypothetical protein